ncbi:hypothetical protein C8R43DRAFT_1112860 [Mycena crocata]|nr:hypothetical protein C8R43DRAFT_1112860 [Mycena crocata]
MAVEAYLENAKHKILGIPPARVVWKKNRKQAHAHMELLGPPAAFFLKEERQHAVKMDPKTKVMPQFYLARGKLIHIVIAILPLCGGLAAWEVQTNTVRTRGLALVAVFWPPAAVSWKKKSTEWTKNGGHTGGLLTCRIKKPEVHSKESSSA